MALVAAICTQCGAKLEVDDTKDAGICPYCGTPFVTEKVIKQYITNNYNNQTIVKHIYGNEQTEATEYIERAEVFLKLGEWKNAEEQFRATIKVAPADWHGWFGIAECYSKNFTDFADIRHEEYIAKARKVASTEAQHEFINSTYQEYVNRRTEYRNKISATEEAKSRTVRHAIVALVILLCIVAAIAIPIAVWENSPEVVMLDARGGTLSTTKIKVTKADNFEWTTLPTPTREGYIFDGWYYATAWATKVEIGDKATGHMPKGHLSIYARWGQRKTITVTNDNYKDFIMEVWYTDGKGNLVVYTFDNKPWELYSKGRIENIKIESITATYNGSTFLWQNSTYSSPYLSGSKGSSLSISGTLTATFFEKPWGGFYWEQ